MSIIQIVEEELAGRDIQVDAVHVKIGQLAGISKYPLLSSYEMACERTSLEGSRLVIEEVPALMDCPRCRAQTPIQSAQWCVCSVCGSPAAEIVQGRELIVSALEVRE